MTLEDVLAAAEKIRPTLQGWCSAEKTRALVETIVSAKPKLCVEIGVFGGSSLIPQALALKHNANGGVAVGIDPWSRDAVLEELQSVEHRDWWAKVDLASILAGCKAAIAKHGLTTHCRLVQDKAENVYSQFADESIDLLHIDGNHSESLAYKDATLYLPKVRSGGTIFFDDVYWVDGGTEAATRKAIKFLLESCTKLHLVGDCMLLQKD